MPSVRGRIESLRLLCRSLGGDEVEDLSATRWTAAVDLADELLVAPALWVAMSASDRACLPAAVTERLRRDYVLNAARNLRLRRMLEEIVSGLNRAGVEPLLFKGSAWLVAGDMRGVGGRWMADLDLAVDPRERDVVQSALVELGYVIPSEKPFWHVHEIPFVGADASGPLELHFELGGELLARILPFGEAWADSRQVRVGEQAARILSPTHAVLQNILHAVVQDFGHAGGDLPVRQLLVLRALVENGADDVDWTMIRDRMARHNLSRELEAHLWLAYRYVGMPLPRGGWVRPRRLHELRVLIGVGLGWPALAHRKLRYALGSAYLDSLYGHGNRPLPLLVARARHVVNVSRRDGAGVIDQLLGRRS